MSLTGSKEPPRGYLEQSAQARRARLQVLRATSVIACHLSICLSAYPREAFRIRHPADGIAYHGAASLPSRIGAAQALSYRHYCLPELVQSAAVGATAPIVVYRRALDDFLIVRRKQQRPQRL